MNTMPLRGVGRGGGQRARQGQGQCQGVLKFILFFSQKNLPETTEKEKTEKLTSLANLNPEHHHGPVICSARRAARLTR